jgi:hypothetical protein
MARTTACPKCRKSFALPAVKGSALVACPFCATRITVMMKRQLVGAAAGGGGSREPENHRADTRPIKRKRRRRKDVEGEVTKEVGIKMVVVGAALLLATLFIVVAFWLFLKSAKGGDKVVIPTSAVQ